MKKLVFPAASILAVLLLTYSYKSSIGYKYYSEKGNILLSHNYYSSALDSYKKAVSFKDDSIIDEKIKDTSKLQEDTNNYNTAVDFMNNRKYDKALEIFDTIPDFEGANDKIKECISSITEERIKEAEASINQKDYKKALNILNSAASLANENEEVKNLITSCNNSLNEKLFQSKRKDLLESIKGVYKLLVELETQHVYVYKYNKLIKTMVCSSGMTGSDTPEGKFKVTDRGEYFYSDKYNEGAYYWVRFNKAYLFHSIPFDKNGNVILSEADKLGEKASHGCVRLSMEDAEWIYENIPKNISRVLVY